MTTRKIIHVDMDAFYASVEQRDFPEKYAGKPIAGGVHSAMASAEVERRCLGLIFVKPRMDVYRAVSRRVLGRYAYFRSLSKTASRAAKSSSS